ncbi:site-specific DNA-methyltransferase [Lactobacillus crispatus]|uniref:site-specific DNA-methyltransferase n=1 Tax=Lactobacillus crispatus TaxID=47770 RepID=UPI00130365F6|nr:site-specific DNA-methyltransferase [Lactobacillus crispatus]QGY94682.1 site-specific DNA-methyltransferase [Lactobacillus crispatus]
MQTDNEKYNKTVRPNTAFLNELKNKLPEFFTKDGSFDLDKFKTQLKEKNINELSEGYQLNFIGKDYARRQAGETPNTVIVPDKKQNGGGGAHSKNLFFTGDNLEVLRHLQTAYANKIDVIYIDPPYNTGQDDFAYPDSFEYTDDQLEDMFGLDDDQLARLKSIQGKSSHSAWLTFMYPRLVLAKRVMKDEGLIFISIDDNESDDLRLLMNEIFGESNFLMQVAWRRTDNQPNLGELAKVKEYILAYSKNPNKRKIGKVPLSGKALNEYRYEDKNGKFRRGILLDKTRGRYRYTVTTKSGNKVNGPWMISEQQFKKLDNEGLIYWTTSGKELPYKKTYLINNDGAIVNDFWGIEVGTNQRASSEFLKLMGARYFAFPKPTSLIKRILNLSSPTALVMDFFAGSSTTADAVMQLNAKDGGHRKFIMVQLPEKTYHTNKDGKEIPTKGGKIAYDAGFKSIDEISRERIRRAAKKIKEANELTLPEDFDGSFKHYRVVKPTKQTLENIDDFDPNNTNLFTNMVEGFSSKSLNIPGDASGEETILTTWLAQDGYPFDINIQEIKFGNYHAHMVDNHLYLINEGWSSTQTKELLNQLGTNELDLQTVVLFGYSFNILDLRELENGLKQLDSKVTLIKRY